jgi:hypothetical protein
MIRVCTSGIRAIHGGALALSRHTFRALHLGMAAAVTCTLAAGAPNGVRAADSDCGAVRAAVALQSKTPFHATVTNTPTRAGTIPVVKNDMIWIDNTLYLSMNGRWVGGPMPPERALVGVTGGNLPFSECKRLPDSTASGQPTSVYSAVMQSGEHVQLFISATSGQLLREMLDQNVMKVTVDFEYTNVHAPALSK